MRLCTGFWVGMGAGIMAGAAVGMMLPYGRDPMKTQVGKSIHKLGVAVDHAVDSIVSEMRCGAGRRAAALLFFSKSVFSVFGGLTFQKALV